MALPEPQLDELSVVRICIIVDGEQIVDVSYAGGASVEERVRQGIDDLSGQQDEIVAKLTSRRRVRGI